MSRGIVSRIFILAFAASLTALGCATTTGPPGSVAQIVTFEVAGGARFKVLVADPKSLDTITALANSEDAPSIPNGRIVRQTGVNTGWSWSLDPTDFTFVDVTDTTCDGTPEEVEAGTFDGDRFCPWSAIVVATEPAP